MVLLDIKKSTGIFNLHKLYWYKARSALNWSPVVRLEEVFGIDFQTRVLLAHRLFQHVTPVLGGSERWPWGGFWRFLRSEQPVQWNRKHHHQCLYKGLLLWKTGGREGWGESMNLIYLFFSMCKGSGQIGMFFNCGACVDFHHLDRICTFGRRKVCVPHPSVTHVWIYDQLHPQTQTPAGEIHDEQCTRELHHPTGVCLH